MFRLIAAIQRIAQNRTAYAFHGHAQLMGFAGKRLQHKQPQTGLQALAAETGNGKIILITRQLPCTAPRTRHTAFHPALLFRRLVRTECQISFTHGFLGKLCRQSRRAVAVERKQQQAAGGLVQSVNQPHAFNAELLRQRSGQANIPFRFAMHRYAARLINDHKVFMFKNNVPHFRRPSTRYRRQAGSKYPVSRTRYTRQYALLWLEFYASASHPNTRQAQKQSSNRQYCRPRPAG